MKSMQTPILGLLVGLCVSVAACRSSDDDSESPNYQRLASGNGTLSQVGLDTVSGTDNSADASNIVITGAPHIASQTTAAILGIKDGLLAGGPAVFVGGAAAEDKLLLTLQRSPWLENIGSETKGAPSLLTAKVAGLKGDHTMEMNKNLAVIYQLAEGTGSRFGFINHQSIIIEPELARFQFQGAGLYQAVYVWDSNANYDVQVRPDVPLPAIE